LDGKLAFTSIMLDDFAQAGAIPSDSEDLVNKTLAIGGTEMALIVVEQPGGGFKISFRSRCGVDCSKVAAQFGGGGHRQASGAFQNLPYDELKAALIAAMAAAHRR
jgi:phosphoesterase RecJ-like protein